MPEISEEIVPGTYSDWSFEQYAAVRAINSGVVKAGSISMKHMLAALDGKFAGKDTEDRKLGRAIHCRLLEPERFRLDYRVATSCCAILGSGPNKGKRCGNSGRYFDGVNWFCGSHKQPDCDEPDNYIDEAEAERIEEIADALHEHPVMELFRGQCWTELSCVWEVRGWLRKCRIDRFSRDPKPRIIDLKKCLPGKGTREEMEKAIHAHGYHRQMAGNIEAIEVLEGVTAEGIWVFIEDGPPYDVNIMPADPQTIAIGRFENNEIIGRFAAAHKTGKLPGYIYDRKFIRYGGLPLWYRRQCAELGIGVGDSAGTDGAGNDYADFGDVPRAELRCPVSDEAVN